MKPIGVLHTSGTHCNVSSCLAESKFDLGNVGRFVGTCVDKACWREGVRDREGGVNVACCTNANTLSKSNVKITRFTYA